MKFLQHMVKKKIQSSHSEVLSQFALKLVNWSFFLSKFFSLFFCPWVHVSLPAVKIKHFINRRSTVRKYEFSALYFSAFSAFVWTHSILFEHFVPSKNNNVFFFFKKYGVDTEVGQTNGLANKYEFYLYALITELMRSGGI